MPRNVNRARVSRRPGVTLGLLRALASTSGVLAVYYLAPLGREPAPGCGSSWSGDRCARRLTVHQVQAILRATHPGVRAVEALATTVPMFLLRVLGRLLPDVARGHRQLRRHVEPDRRALLHRHRVRHGGLRRHRADHRWRAWSSRRRWF